MPTLVKMPKWGLTMTTGTVTGWIASEGDEVSAGAPLLTVETEKAVNDVEAPAGGVLRKIVADTGAEVPVSGPIAVIAEPGETLSDEELAAWLATAAPASALGAAGPSAARAERKARPAARDDSGRVNASPAARKRAKELGVDLATVEATGSNGRVTSEDVERAATASDASGEEATIRGDHVSIGGGRKLFAISAGPADATPPLVFLHGLGGSRTTWMNLLGELVERHNVTALDLPGHGQSDKPDPESTDYSVVGLAEAVASALGELALQPAVLVGHSLGGALAIHVALEHPELVRGLVLINSAGLGSEINPELLDRVEAEPSPEEARQLLDLFLENKRLILDRGVEEMYQARLAPGASEALRAIADTSFSRDGQRIGLENRLAEIAAPTLVIWGEEDRVIPVAHASAATETIPGAGLDILEGIGHVPQVEAAPEVARLIDTFVQSLPESK